MAQQPKPRALISMLLRPSVLCSMFSMPVEAMSWSAHEGKGGRGFC
jgi:hypothetical protein